jgi:hypothetical protein
MSSDEEFDVDLEDGVEDEEVSSCMWCTASPKRCAECNRPVCARHASRSNNCCGKCLAKFQRSVKVGRYCTSNEDDALVESIGGPRANVYGETTPNGVRTLSKHLKLTPHDLFADLGSGLGLAVLQAAREFGVTSYGVERAEGRHRVAERALSRQAEDVASRVRLFCADCADPQLWREELTGRVTVVYASNLLFSAELNQRLSEALEAGGAPLRAVAALRPFTGGLLGFEEKEPFLVETTWRAPEELGALRRVGEHEGSLVYLYVRPCAVDRL